MILKGITLASLLLLNPQWTIGSRGFNPPSGGGGGEPTFTEVQSNVGAGVGSGTSFSVTLNSAPTAGNAVVCGVAIDPTADGISAIEDNAATPNSYPVTPHSPAIANTSTQGVSLAVLLNVPSGAGSTITVTVSGSLSGSIGASLIRCTEFHRSSGTWALDNDFASTTTASVTTANTPTVTSSAAGELLYSYAVPYTTTTSANTPWTQGPGGEDAAYAMDAYILSSASGGTALNFTFGSAGGYNAMGMALK